MRDATPTILEPETADPDSGTAELLRRTAELAIAYRADLPDRPVAPTASAADMRRLLGGPLPDHGEAPLEIIERLARDVPAGLMAMPGPRFFGFVIGGGLPAAVAADWLTTVWDQNDAYVRTSPAAAIAEAVAGEWLVDLFGLPAGDVGRLRQRRHDGQLCLPRGRPSRGPSTDRWDVEANGLQGAPRVNVVLGDDAHVTVFAGLRMLGLGAGTAVRVEADGEGRIRPAALRRALAGISGPTIVCLQAGNVNSGAFDPLAEAIAIVRAHGDAWVHVDGAFGLWAAAHPGLSRICSTATPTRIRGPPMRTNGSTCRTTAAWRSFATPRPIGRRWG